MSENIEYHLFLLVQVPVIFLSIIFRMKFPNVMCESAPTYLSISARARIPQGLGTVSFVSFWSSLICHLLRETYTGHSL